MEITVDCPNLFAILYPDAIDNVVDRVYPTGLKLPPFKYGNITMDEWVHPEPSNHMVFDIHQHYRSPAEEEGCTATFSVRHLELTTRDTLTSNCRRRNRGNS